MLYIDASDVSNSLSMSLSVTLDLYTRASGQGTENRAWGEQSDSCFDSFVIMP